MSRGAEQPKHRHNSHKRHFEICYDSKGRQFHKYYDIVIGKSGKKIKKFYEIDGEEKTYTGEEALYKPKVKKRKSPKRTTKKAALTASPEGGFQSPLRPKVLFTPARAPGSALAAVRELRLGCSDKKMTHRRPATVHNTRHPPTSTLRSRSSRYKARDELGMDKLKDVVRRSTLESKLPNISRNILLYAVKRGYNAEKIIKIHHALYKIGVFNDRGVIGLLKRAKRIAKTSLNTNVNPYAGSTPPAFKGTLRKNQGDISHYTLVIANEIMEKGYFDPTAEYEDAEDKVLSYAIEISEKFLDEAHTVILDGKLDPETLRQWKAGLINQIKELKLGVSKKHDSGTQKAARSIAGLVLRAGYKEAKSHLAREMERQKAILGRKKAIFERFRNLRDEEEEEDIDLAEKVPGTDTVKYENFFTLLNLVKAQYSKHYGLGRRGVLLQSSVTSEFVSIAWQNEVVTDLFCASGDDFVSFISGDELVKVRAAITR